MSTDDKAAGGSNGSSSQGPTSKDAASKDTASQNTASQDQARSQGAPTEAQPTVEPTAAKVAGEADPKPTAEVAPEPVAEVAPAPVAEVAPPPVAEAPQVPIADAPQEPVAQPETKPEVQPEAAPQTTQEAQPTQSAEPEGAPAPNVSPAAEAQPKPDGEAQPEAAQAEAHKADGDAAKPEGETKSKKRRRRRRKKKKASAEAADGATPAAPGANKSKPGEGKKKKAKPKPLERPAFDVNDEVFGRVSKITRWAIFVDVAGGKAHGLFDRGQLIQVPPKEGEQFIAKVKSYSTRGGMLMLGPEAFDTNQARAELRAALQSEQPLTCWVTGVIKGGLEVDYGGVRAFAPASHVDLKPTSDLGPMLGEPMEFVVTHYAKKGRDVVVSRKPMLEAEYKEKRGEQLKKLEPGMKAKATVRTVLQWGVFVSLPEYGDIEGVVHMSEASHDRGAKLDKLFKPGDTVDVAILKIDDKGKLWLSRKATIEDPWAKASEKYKAGTRHTGKVVRLTDFGAFIQLESGIDGLCHVADLAFEQVEHPKDVVKVGQDLDVVVAHLDSKNKKVSLHPCPPEDELDKLRRGRIKQYDKVEAVVTKIHDKGLGVRIIGATGRQARGYIPAGQTGTPRGTDLRKKFPLGSKVEAKVIDVDRRGGEARLSIRGLKEDAEKQAYREYRKKVQREATFGTFGDLLKDKLADP